MKSLTGISQGFDKCTKATMQNNYFCGTPPDDCFCLEIWSRYHYNKKRRKFKTILILGSIKKMSRKKLTDIMLFMEKVFQVFQCIKKSFHGFSFQFCSTANSKFYFYVSLCEINCIKIQTIGRLGSILAEILCFVYFDGIIRQRLKKSSG